MLLTLVAAPLVAPSAVAVDGETCQGKPATIVQQSGTVNGTDGDDVIVAGLASKVYAGRGDDTICATGGLIDGGGHDGHDRVEVRGTSRGDHVTLVDVSHMDVRLGAGPDEVTVTWTEESPAFGSLDLGGAHDLLVVKPWQFVTLDLEDHYFSVLGALSNVTLAGLEDVTVKAPYAAQVFGDAQDNRLRASACEVRVLGGKGDDVIFLNRPAKCERPRSKAYGQKGDDRLRGGAGADLLVGGPGRDTADGRNGKDRCLAEVAVRCEE